MDPGSVACGASAAGAGLPAEHAAAIGASDRKHSRVLLDGGSGGRVSAYTAASDGLTGLFDRAVLSPGLTNCGTML